MRVRPGRTPLKYRTNKGMALVMMLVLVPILMFLAMSFVDPIVRSFRAAVNDQKTLLAKSVADSMFEVALWNSRGKGIGETVAGTIDRDYEFGHASGDWSVIGTPEVDTEHLVSDGASDFYTVPAAGSGDAGGDYCSTAEPVIDSESLKAKLIELGIPDLGAFYNALDWPCHWNKLHEGESVIIPLYTESEGVVQNPVNLGLDEFELRIRPACDPSQTTTHSYGHQICDSGNRFNLKSDPIGDFLTVIVLWEIVGKDENGKDIYLTHYQDLLSFQNSFFNVNAINNDSGITNSSVPLNQNSITLDQDGLNPSISNYLPILHKPVLRLMVIHTLRDTFDNIVPYLEYQFKAPIVLSTDAPIASTSKVVRVEVMIDGGYSETIEKTIALPKPVSGFVIQQ